MEKRINWYADFDDSQKRQIGLLATSLDKWIRLERLPKLLYALLTFADEIERTGVTFIRN